MKSKLNQTELVWTGLVFSVAIWFSWFLKLENHILVLFHFISKWNPTGSSFRPNYKYMT